MASMVVKKYTSLLYAIMVNGEYVSEWDPYIDEAVVLVFSSRQAAREWVQTGKRWTVRLYWQERRPGLRVYNRKELIICANGYEDAGGCAITLCGQYHADAFDLFSG